MNTVVTSSGSSSATTWATARISGIAAPVNLPPFPQAHLAQVWSTPFLATSGTDASTFQELVTGSVAVINSGNVRSNPGSIAFYAVPQSGPRNTLTTNGQSSLPIPALNPGQSVIFYFQQNGSSDSRLMTAPGVNPSGQDFLSVVTYSDPVADYDGSQKVLRIGAFP